jgi:hypothetical protein
MVDIRVHSKSVFSQFAIAGIGLRRISNARIYPWSFSKSIRHLLIYCFSFVCLYLATLPTITWSAPTNSPAVLQEQPDDNKLRLLNIRVGGYVLDGLLTGYAEENMILIPLTALADTVDLAIDVKIAEGKAEGFLYKEERTFYLDIARGEVVLSGRTSKFDPTRVKIYPDDIYVDSALLSQWLPFRLDVDLFTSQIRIISDEKLPFEERLERERRLKSAQAHRRDPDPGFPRHFEPYKQWRAPFINQTLDFRGTRDGPTGQTSGSFFYTTYATGELFKMESSLYLSGTQDNLLETGRLTFSRSDPSARLLGSLNARKYAFGHVETPNTYSITLPQSPVPGAYVSNQPLYRQNEFDKHTFRGDLLPGWEVELYQNNALIGLQRPNAEGQYVFEDVPLFFGRNYFRLVFYGPQGQKREETQNFDINDALVKVGEHQYLAFSGQDEEGGLRGSAHYTYGVSKNFNVGVGLDQITLGPKELLGAPAESYQYGRAGAQMLLAGSYLTADLIGVSDGGSAADLGWQTRIGQSSSLTLKSIQMKDYISERFPLLVDPTKAYWEGTLNTAIPQSLIARIPFQLRWSRFDYESGAERTELSNRISFSGHRFSLSNSLTLVSLTSAADTLNGLAQLSYRGQKASMRGEVNYSTSPISELTSAGFTVDQIRYKQAILSFQANRLLTAGYDQYVFNINSPKGKVAYTFGANYATNGTASIDFRITFGLGKEPRTDKWKIDADPIAGRGAISARVFLDHDQDGLYSEGDEPLEKARFRINGGVSQDETNKEGVAFITSLQAHNTTDVGLALESLEDPTWTPSIQGVRLVPRPGGVSTIDFPVIETGEIDGTVYFKRNGRFTTTGEVELELINETGKVVDTTKTAFDGFYVFTVVPDGKYLVRVSPAQIEKLGLAKVRPIEVRVSRQKQFVSGINFAVEKALN